MFSKRGVQVTLGLAIERLGTALLAGHEQRPMATAWSRRSAVRIVVAGLVVAMATVAVAEPEDPLREGGGTGSGPSVVPIETEEVLQRAFLPSSRNVQGEFRLLRRGEQWVAQTVLHTTSLRRAIQKIRRKELGRWSNDMPSDAVTYLAALIRARDEILGHAQGVRGRRQLIVEVGFGPDSGYLAFYRVKALEVLNHGLTTIRGDQLEMVDVTQKYAKDSVGKQVVEAFGESPPALQEILEKP